MNTQINRRSEDRYLAPEGMRILISGMPFTVIDVSRSGMGCQYRGIRPEWLNVGIELHASIEWPVTGFLLQCYITVRNLSLIPHGGLRIVVSLRDGDTEKIIGFLK